MSLLLYNLTYSNVVRIRAGTYLGDFYPLKTCQWGCQYLLPQACLLYCGSLHCVLQIQHFYKLKLCGDPALSKLVGIIFLTAFDDLLSLCHILVILVLFQSLHQQKDYNCSGLSVTPLAFHPQNSSVKDTGVGSNYILLGIFLPGIEPWSPVLQADSFPSEPPEKPSHHDAYPRV